MSQLEVSYKGNNIIAIDENGNKKLNTKGKYCEDDINIKFYNKYNNISAITISVENAKSAQLSLRRLAYYLWSENGYDLCPTLTTIQANSTASNISMALIDGYIYCSTNSILIPYYNNELMEYENVPSIVNSGTFKIKLPENFDDTIPIVFVEPQT